MRPLHTFRILSAWASCLVPVAGPRAQTALEHWPGDTVLTGWGWTLVAAGDIDLDGVMDLAMGDPWAGGVAAPVGAVRLLSGADGSVLWETPGEAIDDQFGRSLDRLDDVDGDGVVDFVCGAPLNDAAGGSAGAVYVLSGATGAVLYTILGDNSLDHLGYSVAGMGDVDGDGAGDFAVGAPDADPAVPLDRVGLVRLYTGATGDAIGQHDGTEIFGGLGYALAAIGDVDGDGLEDLAAGAPGEDKGAFDSGAVRILSGAGLAPLYTLSIASASARFGNSVAGTGDLDGDGVGDVLVGAPTDASSGVDSGGAYTFSGASGAPLLPFQGAASGDWFGVRVAGPGDVTADGDPDLLVSALFEDAAGTDSGRVRLFSGVTGSLVVALDGAGSNALHGSGLAGLGDLNGDGWVDYAVGAYGETQPGGPFSAGAVWIYSGRDCPSTAYCTAKTNSQGCLPRIGSFGVPNAAGASDDFDLVANDVLNERPGLFFWGFGPAALPFAGGWLCVSPPLQRTPAQKSGGSPPPAVDCSGSYLFLFTQAYMASKGLGAGSTVYGQYYMRDSGFPPPGDVGLTGGLSWTICP